MTPAILEFASLKLVLHTACRDACCGVELANDVDLIHVCTEPLEVQVDYGSHSISPSMGRFASSLLHRKGKPKLVTDEVLVADRETFSAISDLRGFPVAVEALRKRLDRVQGIARCAVLDVGSELVVRRSRNGVAQQGAHEPRIDRRAVLQEGDVNRL